MKKITLMLLVFSMVSCLLAGCGNSNETGEKTGSTNELPDDGKELQVIMTEGHSSGWTMEEELNTNEYTVKRGENIDLGGISELVITVTDITEDSMSFTTSLPMSTIGHSETMDEFSVSSKMPLKISDNRIDDASSWYVFQIGTDIESASSQHKITYGEGNENIAKYYVEKAYPGDSIIFETIEGIDDGKTFLVNGEDLCTEYADGHYYFIMPSEDVEITVTD